MVNSAIQGGGELPETDEENGIIDLAAGNNMEGKPSVKFANVCSTTGASAAQAKQIKNQDFSLLDGSACLKTGKPFSGIAGNGFLMRVNGSEFFEYGINGKKTNNNVSNCGAWQLTKSQTQNSESTDDTSSIDKIQETLEYVQKKEKELEEFVADMNDDNTTTVDYKYSRFSMTYTVNKEESKGKWLVIDITVKNEGEPVKVYGMFTDRGKDFEYVKGFNSITSTKPFMFGTGATKDIKVHIENEECLTKFKNIRFRFYSKKYTTIETITINNLKL